MSQLSDWLRDEEKHYSQSIHGRSRSERCAVIASEIEKLEQKLKQETLRREEAEEVIEFYAEGNSHYDSKYEWGLENHCKETGTATLPSGEKAREYKDKYKDEK